MTIIEQNDRYKLYRNGSGQVILEEKATARIYLCHKSGPGQKYRCVGRTIPEPRDGRALGHDQEETALIVDLTEGISVFPEGSQ